MFARQRRERACNPDERSGVLAGSCTNKRAGEQAGAGASGQAGEHAGGGASEQAGASEAALHQSLGSRSAHAKSSLGNGFASYSPLLSL